MLLSLVAVACVVGGPPPASSADAATAATPTLLTEEFASLERRYMALAEEARAAGADADRLERLQLSRSLAARYLQPFPVGADAVLVYLEALYALELTAHDAASPALEGGPVLADPVEQPVGGVDATPPPNAFAATLLPGGRLEVEGVQVTVAAFRAEVAEAVGYHDAVDVRLAAAPELPYGDLASLMALIQADGGSKVRLTVLADDASAPGLAEVEQSARDALAAGKASEAVALLEGWRDSDAWTEGQQTLWLEAVDVYVHEQREAAGRRFLAARELPDALARAAEMRAVEGALAALLADYPESSYRDALERNLQLVRKELATLEPG